MDHFETGRRGFLKRAAMLAAATALPTGLTNVCAATAKPKPTPTAAAPARVACADAPAYDVIVVGGGPAGCAAAVAAAREGCRTLLLEAGAALGGLGTSGMVPAWCPFSDGERIIYRGLAERVFRESKKGVPHEPADKTNWVTINSEHLIGVYDRLVAGAGVDTLFFSRVAAVEMAANGVVDAVVVANKAGLTAFRARVVVDASGDGDVAHWAGAETMMGDDNGQVQQSTLCFSVANVDTQAYLNGPELNMSKNRDCASARAARSGRYPLLDTHCCHNLIGPTIVQFNANHVAINDPTDPRQLSQAMMLGRQVAEQHVAMLREFRPDAFANAFIVKTAVLPGIRESRRVVGDYIFTADDWRARRSFDDEIGRNCYRIDVHKKGYSEVYYKRGESHGIPYRCLTPKGLRNVLVAGRCLSADEVAHGSLRVMPPSLVTGEAAGIAAHLASSAATPDVHAVDVADLRARLRAHGQYLP